jgi:site-specific DNA-methyltransferase (adenine-specific)
MRGQSSTGGKGVIPATKKIYANEWQGYRTPAIKPAYEPILCFRAPRQGLTYAELALRFGTGGLNIEGSRIGVDVIPTHNAPAGAFAGGEPGRGSDPRSYNEHSGRFPTNLILDEEAAKLLGERSRFFYCAKASRQERNAGCEDLPLINSGMSNGAQTHGDGYDKGQGIGLNRVIGRRNPHPCVKPLALARHLATLLLPPASVAPRRLLVPFAGTASEVIGAMQAGWDEIVGIEQDARYCEIAKRRVDYWRRLPPESPDRTDAA